MAVFSVPLTARDRHVLQTLAINRISGKRTQDERSLDDQEAGAQRLVARHYAGAAEFTFISTVGKGEALDREELARMQAAVESRRFDLVLAEDLGRIMRRMHAFLFCELCEDCDTRLIAPNDGVDTAEDWRVNAFFASLKHEMANRDTSNRIKRTLDHRFELGGALPRLTYGYVKPPGAKSDADVVKDPAATRVFDHWFTMWEEGAGFGEAADWTRAQKIPYPPTGRSEDWDGRKVARIAGNPILKGERQRGRRRSKRQNRTGRYVSIKAEPDYLKTRQCPHLAHFEPERYDRVMRMLGERNGKYARGKAAQRDLLQGRPKRRTRWPGQQVDCGICGRPFVYGGHGQKDHLMCTGAREHRCWNGATFDGPLAAAKLADAVLEKLRALPDFDAELRARVLAQQEAHHRGVRDRLGAIKEREARLKVDIAQRVTAVSLNPTLKSLSAALAKDEEEQNQLAAERQDLERRPAPVIDLPSMAEIQQSAAARFRDLPRESPEFGRFMQQLIHRITVYPCRLCEGKRIVLRARFTLRLVALVPRAPEIQELEEVLSYPMEVDLHEAPQREAYRLRIAELQAQGKTIAAIAASLGLTKTAVLNAGALTRKMAALGLADPYVPLTAPPAGRTKLRRHLHPRYHFEPLSATPDLVELPEAPPPGPADPHLDTAA